MEFHHIGVATDDLDELAERYRTIFDLEVVHEETLEQLRVAFIALEDGYLELLEPLGDSGPIANYLENADTAMHHVAFGVSDIESAIDRAVDAGVRPIDETPRPGAWGHEVAFLNPSDTGGMLVEFVQD